VGKNQVDQLVAVLEEQMTNLDARMKVLERQLDGLFDSVQQRLPEQAGDALAKARKAGAEARKAATEAGEKLTSFVRDSAA
jgi:ABC-type transporter Mla subunit MlaD